MIAKGTETVKKVENDSDDDVLSFNAVSRVREAYIFCIDDSGDIIAPRFPPVVIARIRAFAYLGGSFLMKTVRTVMMVCVVGWCEKNMEESEVTKRRVTSQSVGF